MCVSFIFLFSRPFSYHRGDQVPWGFSWLFIRAFCVVGQMNECFASAVRSAMSWGVMQTTWHRGTCFACPKSRALTMPNLLCSLCVTDPIGYFFFYRVLGLCQRPRHPYLCPWSSTSRFLLYPWVHSSSVPSQFDPRNSFICEASTSAHRFTDSFVCPTEIPHLPPRHDLSCMLLSFEKGWTYVRIGI